MFFSTQNTCVHKNAIMNKCIQNLIWLSRKFELSGFTVIIIIIIFLIVILNNTTTRIIYL